MLNNINRDTLAHAIAERYPRYPYSWAEYTADRLIREVDARLEQNVAQFIAREPLTDIWVRASGDRLFSVATIMEYQRNDDFVGALTSLNLMLLGNEPLAMQRILRRKL